MRSQRSKRRPAGTGAILVVPVGTATKAAYRNDLAKKAVAALKRQGLDVYGKGWKKAKVKVTYQGR